jgi:hypothetical protein
MIKYYLGAHSSERANESNFPLLPTGERRKILLFIVRNLFLAKM